MKKYENFISLGYFCSVALELQRLGLRSCSSPFDWCISEWSGVERAITDNFTDWLNYDKLYQNRVNHAHYRNLEYEISFFHDFNKYDSLESQLDEVKRKYERRIERFYENIQKPTLFIRYISTNHAGRKELNYLEQNYKRIIQKFKNYNSANEIIFIVNSEYSSEIIPVYQVAKDTGDGVARSPIEKNKKLKEFMSSCIELGGGERK